MKIIKVQNSVTVVLNNGDIISSENCTPEMFQDIMDHREDEAYVTSLLLPEFNNKVTLAQTKKDLMDGITNSQYLVSKGESIYIPSISELSVPEDLVERFILAEKEGNEVLIQTYLNFWTLTSLNPDSRVRQNLFWFLNRYGMTISKSGLFVAYRNVHIKNKGDMISPELAEVISAEYINIKFRQKKDPSDYVLVLDTDTDEYVTMTQDAFDSYEPEECGCDFFIEIDDEETSDIKASKLIFGWLNSEYETIEEYEDSLQDEDEDEDFDEECDCDCDAYNPYEMKGNLAELYAKLSEGPIAPIYTDGYTQTFNIKIGEVVSMPREECDAVQDNTCSRGLHVAGKGWLSRNYFGDVGMMVLVNPADVVAVPPQDNYGKMRTAAYYPVGVVEWDDNGTIIDEGIDDGFEDDFMNKICYNGERNKDDLYPYKVTVPSIPELDKSKINNRLIQIAKNLNKTIS